MRLKTLENKKGQSNYNKRFNMLLKRLNKTVIEFEEQASNASESTEDYNLAFERSSNKIEAVLNDFNQLLKALN